MEDMLHIRESYYLGTGSQFKGLISMSYDEAVYAFGSPVYTRQEFQAPCETDSIGTGYAVM